MKKLKLDDIEDYIERERKRRKNIREMVLTDDDELVSEETFEERIEEKYSVVIDITDGVKHFRDKEFEKIKSEIESDSSVTEDDYDRPIESVLARVEIPISRAYTLVKKQKHPDELDSIEEEAKKQRAFDKAANKVFNSQLEEEEPFPLNYTVGETVDE